MQSLHESPLDKVRAFVLFAQDELPLSQHSQTQTEDADTKARGEEHGTDRKK